MDKQITKTLNKSLHEITFRNKELSDNTVNAYRGQVQKFYEYIEERGLTEGVESVSSWIKETENARTQRVRKQAIKEYLLERFRNAPPAQQLELERFFQKLKTAKPDDRVLNSGYLTRDQVDQLAGGSPERLSLIIQALFWTGCRITELINIKLSDCKVNDHVEIIVRQKRNRDHHVYLSHKLFDRIQEVFQGKVFLFEHDGSRYDRIYITHKINQLSERILGSRVSAHTFRHSKAMFLKEERNLSPDQIAQALGHEKVLTTLTYYFHGSPTAEDQGIE